jgi:hypothetical protein
MDINSKLPFHLTWQGILAGVILGVVFAPQVKRLPGVNRLPVR